MFIAGRVLQYVLHAPNVTQVYHSLKQCKQALHTPMTTTFECFVFVEEFFEQEIAVLWTYYFSKDAQGLILFYKIRRNGIGLWELPPSKHLSNL